MLAVKTNKNIEKFKSDVAGGFDLREVISIIIGLLLGIVVTVVTIMVFHVPMSVAPYIASLFIAIPILLKFFKPNGMGVNMYREKQRAFKKGNMLAYISTENALVYSKNLIKDQSKNDQKEEDFEQFLKKVKKMLLLFVGMMIMIVIAIVVMMNWL